MFPVTIPDELVLEGTVRRIFAAPDGDLTNEAIAPVESLIRRADDGVTAQIMMQLVLEPGELELLAEGGRVWLTMLGAVVPYNLRVLPDGQVP